MKTRTNNWFDKAALTTLFGIEVFVEEMNPVTYEVKGVWKNYAEDGKPFFASTERERERKRKELRKLKYSESRTIGNAVPATIQ